MRNHRLYAPLIVAFIALSGCNHSDKTAKSEPSPKPPATVTATNGTIVPTQNLAGILAPYENVSISSSLTEPADAVYVNEGDHVHAGQALAVLNTDDLRANLAADLATVQSNASSATHSVFAGKLAIAQGVNGFQSARTAVIQAEQTLARDQADLKRYQDLFANGYVAQQQVVQQDTLVRNDIQAVRAAQAAQSTARDTVTQNGNLTQPGLQSSSVDQAKATVAQAQAQANQIRVQIGKAQIVSPVDGFIVNRNLNPGEYPGSRQIFTVQQTDPSYAVLHGSGTQIAPITVGNTVSVVASDLHNKAYIGRVAGILNQITPGSTDFQVKVILANPEFRLRPGMAVTGAIRLPQVSGVRIPIASFNDVSHSSVTVIDEHRSQSVVPVTSRAENGKFAIVDGLTAGSRVLRDGQSTATSSGSGS